MFFAMWDLSDNRWCLLLMATRTLTGDCYSIGVYVSNSNKRRRTLTRGYYSIGVYGQIAISAWRILTRDRYQ